MKNVIRMLFVVPAVLALALASAACDQDGGHVSDTPYDTPVDTPVDTTADTPADVPVDTPVDTPADTAPDPEPDSTGSYSISGTVGREIATCPPVHGGVGTLCVHVLTTCPDVGTEVASTTVASADMSWPYNTVDFTVTGVADGTYQVFAYLDDDESGCTGTLTSGDFYLGDMCVEVTVSGADVTGVTITFNNKQS